MNIQVLHYKLRAYGRIVKNIVFIFTMNFQSYILQNFFIILFIGVSSIWTQAQNSKELRKSVALKNGYLSIPIENSAPKQKIDFFVADTLFAAFNIRLAQEYVDFYTTMDVRKAQGEKMKIVTTEPSKVGLQQIKSVSKPVREKEVYTEKLRPQVHFSAQTGWLNDPNGLVYKDGEYHLFFQHNPYGWDHGNMHWGHAVSTDLLRWEELDIALTPRRYNDWAFSGSAVVDKKNTSGFGTGSKVPLVAVYTSTGRGESLAYSLDNGRTFNDYKGNPVVKHKGRDPKVFWYEPGQHWVMVVFNTDEKQLPANDETFKNRALHIYTSPNLKDWTYQSEVPNFWECPELFELPIEGQPEKSQWVLYGANAHYMLGAFDGKVFTPQTPKIDSFKDGNHYASQTYNNTPDGRRIMIAWGQIQSRDMPFNQMMTFPVELRLKETQRGIRMLPNPIREIEKLHLKPKMFTDVSIDNDKPLEIPMDTDVIHIIAEFEGSDDFTYGIEVNGYKVEFDNRNYVLDGCTIVPKSDGTLKIEIIADKTSLEIFGNDGETYSVRPNVNGKKGVKVYSQSASWDRGNHTFLKSLAIYPLKSIWK